MPSGTPEIAENGSALAAEIRCSSCKLNFSVGWFMRWLLVFVVAAHDAHFLHSRLKRRSLQAQPGRSAVQTGNHPAGFAQHVKNVLPFQTLQSGIVPDTLVDRSQLRQRNI